MTEELLDDEMQRYAFLMLMMGQQEAQIDLAFMATSVQSSTCEQDWRDLNPFLDPSCVTPP